MNSCENSPHSYPVTDMNAVSEKPLLVIGAGCGRTGTKSLQIALETLYGRKCYHMTELIDNHRDHALKWIQVDKMVSESEDGRIDGSIFGEIFAGYVCTVDFPACTYFKQLMDTYPKAKVILTVRDAKIWTESVRATIIPKNIFQPQTWGQRLVDWCYVGWHFSQMGKTVLERTFGEDIGSGDDEQLIKAFIGWNEKVMSTVPVNRLLVFNVRDGWKPLCDFLGHPIPSDPFPHVNTREELGKLIKSADTLGYIVQMGLHSLAVSLVGIIVYVCWGRF
ncbi:unnamed protein product [Calicophoron daubneyi]|uniref:NAD dependent epimerase/dehydratase n=1 Tax=Calicophoron daubneyi TaxID=300641 RepID=A0AAV2SYT0_CALDB